MSIGYINSKTKNIITKDCTSTTCPLSMKDTKITSSTTDFNLANASNKEFLKELPIIDSKKNLEMGNILFSVKNSDSKEEFVFDEKPRTIRFTWEIDAGGYLIDISKELSQTIGKYTLKVIGMRFCDINNLLRIDPNDYLYKILKQQNTWYGKTTFWPIEGTKLHVPIDLSALPMYSQNNEFKGFKGLGIIQISQTKNDPYQLGTTLESIFYKLHNNEEDKSIVKKYEYSNVSSQKTPFCDQSRFYSTKEQIAMANQIAQDLPKHAISLLDNLDAKNKMTFLSEYYLAKGDILTPIQQSSYPEDEDLCSMNNDIVHTINLNKYTKDIKLKLNYTNNEYEESFLYSHPSLSTYFPEGKKLTTELADKYHIPLLVHSNGCLFYANPSLLLLTGYKNIGEIEKIGGLDTLLDAQKLPSNRRPLGSISLYHADGTSIPVSAHLHTIRWNGEKSIAITFVPFERDKNYSNHIYRNVINESTKEKANHPNTGIDAMQLFSILELASDGIAIINRDGTIISTNQAISKLFGYPSQDLLEQPFTKFFVSEDQSMMRDYLSKILALNTENKLEKTTIGRTREGKLLSLRITITKLPFSDCYCIIIRDISEWEKEKKKLYDAKKMAETENSHKSDFLSRVSHEIRTPLNAIIGFAEVIKNQKLGPVGIPRYIEYANYINQSGNLILDIVNDLLDISKIEAGQMNLHFESVSLNETISEAISLIHLHANKKQILIRTSFPKKIPLILADFRSIKQIALNILSNAINFTPSGGKIIISTAYIKDKSVIFRVRDNGIGMTCYELEKAMQPFGQVLNAANVHQEGTGLGLPLTKAMVDANMGKFSVTSIPSKGTLVEITFPVNIKHKGQ